MQWPGSTSRYRRGTAARRPRLRHRRKRSLCPLPVPADRPAHSTVGSSGTSGGPVTRQPGKHQRGSRLPRRRDRRARLVAGRTRTEGTGLSSTGLASIPSIETRSWPPFQFRIFQRTPLLIREPAIRGCTSLRRLWCATTSTDRGPLCSHRSQARGGAPQRGRSSRRSRRPPTAPVGAVAVSAPRSPPGSATGFDRLPGSRDGTCPRRGPEDRGVIAVPAGR
jgi:hypothetical protein